MLVVSLAGGSHTAALQWSAESAQGSVPWYVLNGIGSFFQVSLCCAHLMYYSTVSLSMFTYLFRHRMTQ